MARRTRSVRGRRSRRGGDPPTRAERVKALKTGPPLPSSGVAEWGSDTPGARALKRADDTTLKWAVENTYDKQHDAYRNGYYHNINDDYRTTEGQAKARAYDSPAYKAAAKEHAAALEAQNLVRAKIADLKSNPLGPSATTASRAAVGTPGGRRTRRRGRKGRSTRRRRA